MSRIRIVKSQLTTRPAPTPAPFAAIPAVRSGRLQRPGVCGGEAGPAGECAAWRTRRESGTLQRFGDGPEPAEAPPIVHEVLRSPGRPVDSSARGFMESRFGHDFSSVRVHTDGRAAASARAVNALAYTVGRDVVFGPGQYAPQTSPGRRLLAHELTHVVQQRDASPTGLRIAPADDGPEREATSVAQNLSVDEGPGRLLKASPMLQRQPAPPPDGKKKMPAEKEATTQPPPQKVPAADAKKADSAPAEEKKGVEVAISVGGEGEFKKTAGRLQSEGAAKYTIEVTIPITDKLQVGPLSFVKEASVEGSGGFKFTRDQGTLTNLEAEAAVKAISLDWEKVKVPLGIADFGVSASALASAEYSPMQASGAVKFGVGAEAEAKFKRSEKSPFFVKISGGVEKTYDKEGNADFKWSPLTWKASGAVGVEF